MKGCGLYQTVFKKPTVDDVTAYCNIHKYRVDPIKFIEFYDKNGWTSKNGKPIIDWRSSLEYWNNKNIALKADRNPKYYYLYTEFIKPIYEMIGEINGMKHSPDRNVEINKKNKKLRLNYNKIRNLVKFEVNKEHKNNELIKELKIIRGLLKAKFKK